MEPPGEPACKPPPQMSRASRMSRGSFMSRTSRDPPSPRFEFSNFTNYPNEAAWHPTPSILTTRTDTSAISTQENITDKSMTSLSRAKFRLIIVLVGVATIICLGLVGVAIKLSSKQKY
ncbi:hypothetical protein NP493_257g00011 [Ridgeia piscesae]|uniref:Uncharacterized protein n=1 Tax=Ridgeia piscesae TaxID=27915 RepID=A0AAD9NYA0_RIDPI|nr:hypothetical protein NP493_257g00011 [Ridgeia piscesae]